MPLSPILLGIPPYHLINGGLVVVAVLPIYEGIARRNNLPQISNGLTKVTDVAKKVFTNTGYYLGKFTDVWRLINPGKYVSGYFSNLWRLLSGGWSFCWSWLSVFEGFKSYFVGDDSKTSMGLGIFTTISIIGGFSYLSFIMYKNFLNASHVINSMEGFVHP